MRLTGWIYYHSADTDLAGKLRKDIEKLAQKYDCKVSIGDHLQDGQCSNCGKMTDILFTEECGNDSIRLCIDCDNKLMAQNDENERKVFDNFRNGRG